MKLDKTVLHSDRKVTPKEVKDILFDIIYSTNEDMEIPCLSITLLVKHLIDKQSINKCKVHKDDRSWLISACSKDDTKKAITRVYHDSVHKCMVATDTHRLHIVYDDTVDRTYLEDITYKCETEATKNEVYPDYVSIVPNTSDLDEVTIAKKEVDIAPGGLKRYRVTFSNDKSLLFTGSLFDSTFGYLKKPIFFYHKRMLIARDGGKFCLLMELSEIDKK